MPNQNAAVANPKTYITKRVEIMMGILSLQFVLGMLLNTIGEPDASTSHKVNVLWHVILGAHILVAFILLISAGYILYYAAKNYRQLQATAIITLLAIIAAIIFGSLTARDIHREVMSFFMAMSFMVAISVYGKSLQKS